MGIEWLDANINSESRWMQGLSKLKPEQGLQIGLMNWMQVKYPFAKKMTFASAGGIRTFHKSIAFMKKSGYQPGTYDLNIAIAKQGFYGLYLEVKPLKGGKASDEQLEYGILLRDQGYCARIEYGWDNCVQSIDDYLTENVPFDYAEEQPLPKDKRYIIPGEKEELTEWEERIKEAMFKGITNAKRREAKIAQFRRNQKQSTTQG